MIPLFIPFHLSYFLFTSVFKIFLCLDLSNFHLITTFNSLKLSIMNLFLPTYLILVEIYLDPKNFIFIIMPYIED